MLTADLVRTYVRDGVLKVRAIHPKARERLLAVAAAYLEIAQVGVGDTREAFKQACKAVEVKPTERKITDGLLKLVTDRCDFSMREGVDPPAVREVVFLEASRVRQEGAVEYERDAIIATAAARLELSADEIEQALYADLKRNHLLLKFESMTGEALLEKYEDAQGQAVLLKAVKVRAHIVCDHPGAYRKVFRALKFRRLLHSLCEHPEGGYFIEIDGPHALFRASTKYGLQLALVYPAIRACTRWSIEADLRWGKEKRAFVFKAEGKGPGGPDTARLPDEVEALLVRFKKLKGPWAVRRANKVINLPGVGLSVPELLFTREDGAKVYLEVMGYWSRAAVWKRVELVEAGHEKGIKERMLFAVSSRLRVSEAVLGDDLPGALYVYKGAMSAKVIEARLDRLCD